jgi:hypothetical protein
VLIALKGMVDSISARPIKRRNAAGKSPGVKQSWLVLKMRTGHMCSVSSLVNRSYMLKIAAFHEFSSRFMSISNMETRPTLTLQPALALVGPTLGLWDADGANPRHACDMAIHLCANKLHLCRQNRHAVIHGSVVVPRICGIPVFGLTNLTCAFQEVTACLLPS